MSSKQYANFFLELYETTKRNNKTKRFLLKEYQHELKSIKNWTNEMIIQKHEEFDNNHFSYECLLNIARELWKQPYLVYDIGVSKIDIQKNRIKIDKIIKKCIIDTPVVEARTDDDENDVVNQEEAIIDEEVNDTVENEKENDNEEIHEFLNDDDNRNVDEEVHDNTVENVDDNQHVDENNIEADESINGTQNMNDNTVDENCVDDNTVENFDDNAHVDEKKEPENTTDTDDGYNTVVETDIEHDPPLDIENIAYVEPHKIMESDTDEEENVKSTITRPEIRVVDIESPKNKREKLKTLLEKRRIVKKQFAKSGYNTDEEETSFF